jgi:hypothetical protein
MKKILLFGTTVIAAAAVSAIAGNAMAQTGFAWACAPSTASYNAVVTCAPYAYNSRGGAVDITRSGVGLYSVNFVGLGGRTTAGGNVQVTAYVGTPNIVCNSNGWSSGGADFVAFVRCFKAGSGAAADAFFNILVGWFGQ